MAKKKEMNKTYHTVRVPIEWDEKQKPTLYVEICVSNSNIRTGLCDGSGEYVPWENTTWTLDSARKVAINTLKEINKRFEEVDI